MPFLQALYFDSLTAVSGCKGLLALAPSFDDWKCQSML